MEERYLVTEVVSPLFEDEVITQRTLECDKVEALVVNGEIAKSKEFPHMVCEFNS